MSTISGYGKLHVAKHAARVLKLELEATSVLCENIGTPRALTVALLIKNAEWIQLLDLKCNPLHYNDYQKFSDDYLVTSVLQKNPRLPSGIDKKAVAIGKFYDAEKLCAETNRRIQDFREDPNNSGSEVVELVLKVQSIIQGILGPYPDRKDLEYAERMMAFGPGATTSLSGVVTQGTKFKTRTLDCTKELVNFRAFCFPHLWKEGNQTIRIVEASKLTTVPKNAKTDRVICIEPDLNIYVQKGIGALLRDKLLRSGLDLSTQENNQLMAKRAWTDNLATIDLSAASDTISYETVALLLPPTWVDLLEFARVPATIVDGKTLPLQKFSSMGNGFTFELETLIFYAVALATTKKNRRHDVISYGDDIILPLESVPALEGALNFLGFKVNTDKSFGEGLFHESCGTDWFQGENVRPFYFRSELHDYPSICYLYANNARRWAHRRNGGWACDSRCLPLWLRCFTAVAPKDAHSIPEGYGDVGFITDFDRAKPSLLRQKDGWGGYRFFYRRISAVETYTDQWGCYLAFLSGKRTDFSLGKESLRSRFKSAVKATGRSFDWPDLGPWL